MKTARTLFRLASVLVATGLVLGAAIEHREAGRQAEENRVLRQRLSQLENLSAENQSLASTSAQVEKPATRPPEMPESGPGSTQQSGELARLRNEVDALQQQYRELKTLRADTARVRATLEGMRHNGSQAGNSGNADTPEFEIISANYWTANTNMDVAAELQDRVRSNHLRALASNNIKGDPEYGQTKHLTVVYRVGGVVRTNEFREGDVIVLPPQQSGSE